MSGRKEISSDVRKIILNLHEEGKSYREIGRVVQRPYTSVRNIIKNYNKTGILERKSRSGRPKILTPREERMIKAEVAQNPKISAVKLCNEMKERFNKNFNPQTIRNTLHKAGYHGRVPRRKPFLSEANKKKRLQFAKLHVNKPDSFWDNVIFSDESKFNIFGSDGAQKIWRKANKELQENNVVKTVKHGGGNVMVWGCMAACGVGNIVFIDEKMNKHAYLDILKGNLFPSIEKLGLDKKNFLFQQDNDPKHSSYLVQEWLIYHCQQLKTPPQSPDINPIEHIWYLLEKKIRTHHITSKNSLKEAISTEWANITSNETTNLVRSMRRRLEAVIKANGGLTKYYIFLKITKTIKFY